MKPRNSLLARARPLMPYFGIYPGTWLIIVLATIVGAATEPMIPALFDKLLDLGFVKRSLELWTVMLMLRV